MILKIINPERIVTKERCEIEIEIWRKWCDEMKKRFIKQNRNFKTVLENDPSILSFESQETGQISWRHIFTILKWFEGKVTADYTPGKKIIIK
jgi:hypothetical protein